MTLIKTTAVAASILALGLAAGTAGAQMAPAAQPSEPAPIVLADGPGPYAGWPVLSSEGMPIGTVTFSPTEKNGDISFLVIRKADGNRVKVENDAVSMVGSDSITLIIDKLTFEASTQARNNSLKVSTVPMVVTY